MVRRWCLYLAMVLGCLILMIAYRGWLAWMLLMAVLVTPLFSLAVSLPAMLTVRVKADCAGAVCVNDPVVIGLNAKCRFPMPAYRCRIRIVRTPTGESWVMKQGDMLPVQHCGQLVCRPEKCHVYDYLNLFRLKVRHQEATSVVVMPLPVKMAVPADLERYMALSWKPKPGGGFAENHELRLYRPGDGMNQVHWKLTAKTGKLIIREAMEPVRRRMLLWLEIRGSADVLDIKIGKLLWLGRYLLERKLSFDIHALTGEGPVRHSVETLQELDRAAEQLLCTAPATTEEALQPLVKAAWSCHIGGGMDEA